MDSVETLSTIGQIRLGVILAFIVTLVLISIPVMYWIKRKFFCWLESDRKRAEEILRQTEKNITECTELVAKNMQTLTEIQELKDHFKSIHAANEVLEKDLSKTERAITKLEDDNSALLKENARLDVIIHFLKDPQQLFRELSQNSPQITEETKSN